MSDYHYTIAACRAMVCDEIKKNDEWLHGRQVRMSSVAGIQVKYAELAEKLEKELSRPKPDMAAVNRIRAIMGNLQHTLATVR